ncbi:hypothetical protein [Rhizobium tibeticum]|uniref:hypothetical protein n=1 Tax=Rhizobium tibeticum TaxID=501024 RepID=UPI0027D8250E|nr:hypothetical protein [Rhizobium tibeticum]
MSISIILGRSIIALTIAVAPVGGAALGLSGVAYAKGGNGSGNSGGGNGNGNGGGNGNGNGGNHAGGSSSQGKSDTAGSHGKSKNGNSSGDRPTLKSLFTHEKKAAPTTKSKAAPTSKSKVATTTKVKAPAADFASLSSLNRNYHAYIHSNDPRMAAVSAYVMAYAEFEAENGPDAIPTDPALSDEALRDALSSFTKGGEVTDEALEEAKDILGVGPSVGKIDQIRDTLPAEESVADPDASEPVESDAPPVTVIVEQP